MKQQAEDIVCEDMTEVLLERYLMSRLSRSEHRRVQSHLDRCRSCWELWNVHRWNKAKSSLGYSELREFLGTRFVEYFDSSWALAEEWMRRRPKAEAEIEDFYRDTPHYLYNLLIWKESGQRPNYVSQALPLLENLGCQRILDFGCGIGNDGLELIGMGYEVIFCDFANASTEFLRWRLDKRGLSARIVEPFAAGSISEYDTLWAMDVLEHIPNPDKYLEPFLEKVSTCFLDTEHDGLSGGRHPFHFHHQPKMMSMIFKNRGFVRVPSRHIKCWTKQTL